MRIFPQTPRDERSRECAETRFAFQQISFDASDSGALEVAEIMSLIAYDEVRLHLIKNSLLLRGADRLIAHDLNGSQTPGFRVFSLITQVLRSHTRGENEQRSLSSKNQREKERGECLPAPASRERYESICSHSLNEHRRLKRSQGHPRCFRMQGEHARQLINILRSIDFTLEREFSKPL
jgi:hypothetical protein